MSGHSKWANIRVRKTAQDAKRGKIYTRHARLIEIAARSGGGDPISNSSLRNAIDLAKEDLVPNANIERAIKKGTGELKGEQMAEVLYAAYGPGGTAYLIECLTDNKNRTLSNVRLQIGKHGGNFADTGSVQWMFDRRGVISGEWSAASDKFDQDALELELIDTGAEDISWDDDSVRVITGMNDWAKVRDLLKSKGMTILSAGLSYIAKQHVDVRDSETARKVMDFVDSVEEDEDVSEVHSNAEISVEVAAV